MDLVAIEYIKKLQQLDKTNNYFIFCFEGPHHFHLNETVNFRIIRIPRIPGPIAEQLLLPILVKWYKLDILHSTGNTAPLISACKQIITLHDIIYLERKKISGKGSLYQRIGNYYRRLIVPHVIKKADQIITVSKNEKQTISEYLPSITEKLEYIYNAPSQHFFRKNKEYTLTTALKYKLPTENFILFHGNTDPKKNTENVIRAFSHFVKISACNTKLVITDLAEKELKRILKVHNLQDFRPRIHLTNYVNNEDMPDLYNRAMVFLYPSLRESFGIPIVEAMSCEVPVITSNRSSMPEIAGDSALLTDPEDIQALGKAIFKLCNDEKLRSCMIQKGRKRVSAFSWNSSGLALLNIYNKCKRQSTVSTADILKNSGQPALTN